MTTNYHPSTLQRRCIIDLAQRIESDHERLADWWNSTGITEFEDMTPRELVLAGKMDVLERFLRSILHGDRE